TLEALVEHLEQAVDLALIALDRVRNLLGRVTVKDVRLAHHRAHPYHLEHEPLADHRAALAIRRHQLAGLLREVHQDRAGLEDDEAVLVMIDNRRDAAVRVELEIPRLLLLLLLERDRADAVLEPELLEGDGDLVAV